MILVGCLSAVISAFSPFWGLIFIFAFGVKYQEGPKLFRFYGIFLTTVILLLVGRLIDVISFSDIIVGVGLTSYIYFRILLQRYNYLTSIFGVLLLNFFYGVIRHFVFIKNILLKIALVSEEYMKLFQETLQDSPERLMFVSDLLETAKVIMTKYYPGIWVLTIISGIYISSILISSKLKVGWSHKLVQLPFNLVYSLIIVLGLFLINPTRTIGVNGIIMLGPLFLIQGMSVLDFFWGDYVRKTKILLVLFVLAMVFNPYLIIIIAVLGLTDIWFNFRKISIREEINEDNFD